jgi:hypothetical protein
MSLFADLTYLRRSRHIFVDMRGGTSHTYFGEVSQERGLLVITTRTGFFGLRRQITKIPHTSIESWSYWTTPY